MPWIVGALIVSFIAGIVLVLGFVTPGLLVRPVFDERAVESGVAQILEGSYRSGAVGSVACSPDQPVEPSRSFDYTASIGGQHKTVTVAAKNEEGVYEVGQPR